CFEHFSESFRYFTPPIPAEYRDDLRRALEAFGMPEYPSSPVKQSPTKSAITKASPSKRSPGKPTMIGRKGSNNDERIECRTGICKSQGNKACCVLSCRTCCRKRQKEGGQACDVHKPDKLSHLKLLWDCTHQVDKLRNLKLLWDGPYKLDKVPHLKLLLDGHYRLDKLSHLKLLLATGPEILQDNTFRQRKQHVPFRELRNTATMFLDTLCMTTTLPFESSSWQIQHCAVRRKSRRTLALQRKADCLHWLLLQRAETRTWENYKCDVIRTVKSGERLLCRVGNVPDSHPTLRQEILKVSYPIRSHDGPRRGQRPGYGIAVETSDNSKGILKTKEKKQKQEEDTEEQQQIFERKRRANSHTSSEPEVMLLGTPRQTASRPPSVIQLSSDDDRPPSPSPPKAIVKAIPITVRRVRMSNWPGNRSFGEVCQHMVDVERLRGKGHPYEEAVSKITGCEVSHSTWHDNIDCIKDANEDTLGKFDLDPNRSWHHFRLEVHASDPKYLAKKEKRKERNKSKKQKT
ncbi:hypothetical protein CALVIDRAFT_531878, partial [Calocera viscosa TUFC12733]